MIPATRGYCGLRHCSWQQGSQQWLCAHQVAVWFFQRPPQWARRAGHILVGSLWTSGLITGHRVLLPDGVSEGFVTGRRHLKKPHKKPRERMATRSKLIVSSSPRGIAPRVSLLPVSIWIVIFFKRCCRMIGTLTVCNSWSWFYVQV